MGDIVQVVLDYEAPNTWVKNYASDYTESFMLYNVPEGSQEYNDIVSPYSSISSNVISIRRVQNPFQLGLFRIQKEKRISEGDSTTTVKGYHAINPVDLNTALKYPLDYRRYKQKRGDLQNEGKHPKFYNSLEIAYNSCNIALRHNDQVIIIESDRFSQIKSQGDYVPNYVITLEC